VNVRRLRRTLLVLGTALATVGLTPALAQAAAPVNDNVADATVIGSLPFRGDVDPTGSTSEPNEPGSCLLDTSVWFTWTAPATGPILVTNTDRLSAAMAIFTGTPGALTLAPNGCALFDQRARFDVTAGTTYFIRFSSFDFTDPYEVTVSQLALAANDDFAHRTAIGSVPFSTTVDPTAATRQPDEPSSDCDNGGGTVWYAFTPTTTGSVTATGRDTAVTVFSGTSLSDLRVLECRQLFTGGLPFHAVAGQTYLIRLGGLADQGDPFTFTLATSPPLQASFFATPFDPNIFDTVSFFDNSSDPVFADITQQGWDFGDGTTATGSATTHKYAADGDYPVKLTHGTRDGRVAVATQTVSVRTHDVAIVSLNPPKSARAGQTIRITARVRNTRLPDTVTVELDRSTPGGFVPIGQSTQLVSVGSRTRTTPFTFNYTFTADDQAIGKVTFRATATISDARDALPGDNSLNAPPTTVR
jgi:PKD domain